MNQTLLKKKLHKFALICLVTAVCLFVIDYFFFHYITDSGFTLVKQEEAGKPFVANLIGTLSTLFLFEGISMLIVSAVVLQKNESDKAE